MHQGLPRACELITVRIQIEEALQECLLVDVHVLDAHFTAVLEEITHAPAFTKVASVFAEGQAYIGCGAIAVVAECLHQHGHSSWAVTLVADRLEVCCSTTLSGAFGDGSFDIACRDSRRLGLGDRRAQLEIAIGVTALAGSNSDFPSNPGEYGTAPGIHHCLGSLDL